MGSRNTAAGVENVYAAAQQWIDRALRADDSLFTPGRSIWTSQRLAGLRERFLDRHADWRGPDFFGKLEPLLAGGPPEISQLMAEAVYVTYLIVWRRAAGSRAKLRNINQVLGWSSAGVSVPDDLVAGLEPGIANPGAFYTANFGIHPGYVIEFVEHWKEMEPNERDRTLADPWEFKRVVLNVPYRSAVLRDNPFSPVVQRQALLHLVFPDTFEGIVNPDLKDRIADSRLFSRYITGTDDDPDRRLQQVREGLETDLGRDFDFFDDDIYPQWASDVTPWDEFVERAKTYMATGRLEEEEIGYKKEIGAQLALARDAVRDGSGDWAELLRAGLASRDGHPLAWQSADTFRRWVNSSPDDALMALQAIWTTDEPLVAERVRSFSDRLPESVVSGAGTRARLAAFLLMGLDVEGFPPYQYVMFRDAYRRVEYALPDQDADPSTLYEHALGFLDRFMEEAERRDLPMRHRLDAQSLVWAVQGIPPVSCVPTRGPDLEALSQRLYFEDSSSLRNIVALLEKKKQVIFQGPPGTGKTYVAKELAKCLAGADGSVRIVQFHPSYSYEDFVQGLRPRVSADGQLGYELVEGPLLEVAERARSAPSTTKHFLVIDEINRGNLARILGELYFLLEYRNEGIRLQYQRVDDDDFSLPGNLYIIGTMNTADRSIALVDLALRRRFYFVDFHPDRKPVQGVLRRWLEANAPDMDWVDGVVDSANRLLGEEGDAAIGPSYFMSEDGLSEDDLERAWEHGVLPYIQERLFGTDAERIGQFQLDSLRPADATSVTNSGGEE